MPMPSRSGELKSSSASECERRVPDNTFSPTALRPRSPMLPRSSETSGVICSALVALDGEGAVVPTEAEAIAEDRVYFAFDGGIGRVVEVELGIRMMIVDRGRNDAIADDERADHSLHRAGGPQHASGRGLGRADVHLLRLVAEDCLNRAGFVEIVRWSRCAVRVYVLDVLRLQARIPERALHRALRTLAVGSRRCEMIRVTGGSVSDDLGVNRGAAAKRVLQFFENQNSRAFPHHEAIARRVKRARRRFGTVVALRQRLHFGEAADRHRSDGGFSAARDHNVRVPILDCPIRITYCMSTSGTS